MTLDYMEGMDDAELGRAVKGVARRLALEEVSSVGVAHAAALQLVCCALEVDSMESTVRLPGFTHKGDAKGDWEVIVRKVSE